MTTPVMASEPEDTKTEFQSIEILLQNYAV